MKIVCIGGGPAGLYFSILMKLRNPAHDITIYERNKPDDTFGWGVVFSDKTMENLKESDLKSAEEILAEFAHWDDIDVHIKGEVITSTGHGFVGIGRLKLLTILQKRAAELGVNIQYQTDVDVGDDLAQFADADLIIASDGLNSRIRNRYPDKFQTDIDVRKNKFVWLGTHKLFDAFTFIFEKTEHGWIWVHAYKFDKNTSTFIAECSQKTWDAFGFEHMSKEENAAALERIFAKYLDGNKLMSNANHVRGSAWLSFPRVVCNKWHYKNIVLLGDAAHTAHFSIGSGTKLAFEDAIHLAGVLNSDVSVEEGLEEYQKTRHIEVLKIQNSARNSTKWFEDLERYLPFEPLQFTYSLLTRSQRVSHENLRLRDKKWLESVEEWFVKRAGGKAVNYPVPPMFAPFKLRDMEIMNRVVVSPMCMYSSDDGMPDDFHLVHYGARAQGGASLIFTEMTNISPDARISPACAGLYKPEHVPAWKRVVDFVHASTQAKIAVQLGHAGPKGSTKRSWEGDSEPLPEGNWPLMAASAVAWSRNNQVPRAMTRADMDEVKTNFVRATKMAVEAGFDMVELHAAHGYLLSSFITPLTNKRTDEYGGSLENRLRYPIEIFKAVRAVWPAGKPMSVRISASDWVEGAGVDDDEAVEIARAFHAAGADIINVSAGQTSTAARPVYGRMFQTPFADRIRNEAGVPTIAVGNIYEADHVNSIVTAGRADLCCLARPHLQDPYWTLHAAVQQGYKGAPIPPQYGAGFDQLRRELQRQQEMAVKV